MAQFGILGYENKVIINFFIDEDKEVECHNPACGWHGRIKECPERELASRNEGYKYSCPRCQKVLKTDRWIYYD